MMTITEKAQKEIADYFTDKEAAPVRVYLNAGGCGGPAFLMSPDETKDNDEIFEVSGQQYIIEKDLLEKAAPITIDFTEVGFEVKSAMVFEQTGCAGCSSAGSC